MNTGNAFVNFLFWYETPKVVHIRSKKVGLLGRFLQLCVLSYVIGYVLVFNKGYQEVGKVESSVVTKVKGVVYTDPSYVVPDNYKRVWDVSDLVVPASENEAVFLTTNLVITPNQTRGACSEDPQVQGALCNPLSNNCIKGQGLTLGNGFMTGECIPSAINQSINVCEIEAWCPVEVDYLPLGSKRPLLDTSEFTLLIKNFIEFPAFGKAYRRRNILDDANKTYLQSCHYNPDKDPYCPIFQVNDMVNFAGENFTQLSIKGGVIVITINWDCNLDWDFLEYCRPTYNFRRADDPDTKISPGWNFRYANYHEENRRTLFKAYGIRFIIDVRGQAGKFDILPTMLNVGSGFALFGLTTIVCDFFILYFTKRRLFYKAVKYLDVDGDQVDNNEDELLKNNSNHGYQSIPAS